MQAFWHFMTFYGILCHFMAFYGIWAFLPKSLIRNQIQFFRFYLFFPIFRLFPTFRFHSSSKKLAALLIVVSWTCPAFKIKKKIHSDLEAVIPWSPAKDREQAQPQNSHHAEHNGIILARHLNNFSNLRL